MKGVAIARGARDEKLLLAELGAEEGTNLLLRRSGERLLGFRIRRWRWFLIAEAEEEDEERDEGKAKPERRRAERKEKKSLLQAREERSRVAPSIIFQWCPECRFADKSEKMGFEF